MVINSASALFITVSLQRMKEEIREEAIEFNQNPSGEGHPQGCYYRRGTQKFNEVIHEWFSKIDVVSQKLFLAGRNSNF
jgi:hypothetical protein